MPVTIWECSIIETFKCSWNRDLFWITPIY